MIGLNEAEYTYQPETIGQCSTDNTITSLDTTLDQCISSTVEVILSTTESIGRPIEGKRVYLDQDPTAQSPSMVRAYSLTSLTCDLYLVRHPEQFASIPIEDLIAEWDKYYEKLVKDAKWKISEDTVEDAIKSFIAYIKKKYPSSDIWYLRIPQSTERIPDFIIHLNKKAVVLIEVKNRYDEYHLDPSFINEQVVVRFSDLEWKYRLKGYRVYKVLISPTTKLSPASKKILEDNHIDHITWGRQIMTYDINTLKLIAHKLNTLVSDYMRKLKAFYNKVTVQKASRLQGVVNGTSTSVLGVIMSFIIPITSLLVPSLIVFRARFFDWLRRLRRAIERKTSNTLATARPRPQSNGPVSKQLSVTESLETQ